MSVREALIIAAYEFEDPKFQALRAPSHDAEALAGVLGDPEIGGFHVRTLVNERSDVVTEELETFFSDRKPDDLLLVYFSCHGVKDASGRLYFVMANTKFNRLRATGVASSFVSDLMDFTRSKGICLLLDCCYSGAFLKGLRARGGDEVNVVDHFGEGRGRAIITASRATEYAFEADELTAEGGRPSVFTSAVVRGLRTGEADRDGDGRVTVDDLYDFVYEEVRGKVAGQRPGRLIDVEGDLVLARNPNPPVQPAELPDELERAVTSDSGLQRLGAVVQLAELVESGSPGEALAAEQVLLRMVDDPDVRVKAQATAAVGRRPQAPQGPTAEPETSPPLTPPSPPPVRDDDTAVNAGEIGGPDVPTVDAVADTSSTTRPPRARPPSAWWALGGALLFVASLFPAFAVDTRLGDLSPRDTASVVSLAALAVCGAVLRLSRPASIVGAAFLTGLGIVLVADIVSRAALVGIVRSPGPGWTIMLLATGLVVVGAVQALLETRDQIAVRVEQRTRGAFAAALVVAAYAAAGPGSVLRTDRLFDFGVDLSAEDGSLLRPLMVGLTVVGLLVAYAFPRLRRGKGLLAVALTALALQLALVGIYAGEMAGGDGEPEIWIYGGVALWMWSAAILPVAPFVVPGRAAAVLLAGWTAASVVTLFPSFENARPGAVGEFLLAVVAVLAISVAVDRTAHHAVSPAGGR